MQASYVKTPYRFSRNEDSISKKGQLAFHGKVFNSVKEEATSKFQSSHKKQKVGTENVKKKKRLGPSAKFS